MKKCNHVGEAIAPDGTVLALYEHDGAYVIRVNGVELMSTRRYQSEDRLAELTCVGLQRIAGVRALIGGLGLGFTLRAALRCLAADARVIVAEILPEVVAWHRNPNLQLAGAALNDERVDLRLMDVTRILEESPAMFDAIMLDVDNGADPLTTTTNAHLYRDAGIEMAGAALRPDGRLAYWLAHTDRAFERAVRRVGLKFEVTKVRSHASSGTWHTVLVAHRPKHR